MDMVSFPGRANIARGVADLAADLEGAAFRVNTMRLENPRRAVTQIAWFRGADAVGTVTLTWELSPGGHWQVLEIDQEGRRGRR